MEVNFKDVLQPIFSAFANRVVGYLVNHFGLDTTRFVTECAFFTYDIGDAVITISNIFQREYRDMFYYLRDSLKNPERFEKYCMLIPVVKDEIYFYNFLSRIASIFELAKYCFQYEGNKAYFGIVLKCIENYPDLIYFNTAGGWESLKHTASFFAEIGRPLMLITRKSFLEDGNTYTFLEVFKRLHEEYLSSGNNPMLNSMEMRFLEELSEVSRANASPKSVGKNKHCSPGKSLQDRNECEKKVLTNYLENFIDFEKQRVANPKHRSAMPIEEEKIEQLYNRLSHALYNAVGLMKDISVIEELEKGSQGKDHKGSQSEPTENEGGAGPSTRKDETFQPETKESTGNYGKSTEPESTLAGNGNDKTYNFIVPQKYFDEKFPEKLDECKYLYIARIDPPSRKERMTEPLKKMLDTNMEKKNYRLLTNGDFFVGLPDSPQLETLLVIVDSSTDEETDGDEDLHRLLCLFKKCDLDHENKKEDIHNLRPRKPAIQRDEPRKPFKRSISEDAPKQGRKLKHSSEADGVHVRYVTKLYKTQLPIILDMVMRAKSYVLNSSQNMSFFVAEWEASSSNLPDTSTVFVIDKFLLKKRKRCLKKGDRCDELKGILETGDSFDGFSSIISLPPQHDRELNFLIRSNKFREILKYVYLVGEFAKETEVCYLFAPKTRDESEVDYNREIATVAELYKTAVDNCQAFNENSREFIDSVESALKREVPRC